MSLSQPALNWSKGNYTEHAHMYHTNSFKGQETAAPDSFLLTWSRHVCC